MLRKHDVRPWLRRFSSGGLYVLLRAGVYLAAALFVFGMWATDMREFVSLNGYYRATLLDMVAGRAYRPFAYRCLVPLIVRGGSALIPDAMHVWLVQVAGSWPFVQRALAYLQWEQADLVTYGVSLMAMYSFLVGYLYALRALVRDLFAGPEWLRDLAPLVSLLVLPVFFKRGTHLIYDFATLCLFLSGVLLLHRGTWRWFYPLYILALLNKETAVLLPLLMVIWYWGKMPRGRLAAHVGAQIALFVVAKVALGWAFRGNPGGAFEPHLVENLRLYMRPYWFSAVSDVLIVALLLGWHWREKPAFLRRTSWLLLPLLPLYLVAGGWGEIRAFYELFPILFLLAFQSVTEILALPLRPHTRVQTLISEEAAS